MSAGDCFHVTWNYSRAPKKPKTHKKTQPTSKLKKKKHL